MPPPVAAASSIPVQLGVPCQWATAHGTAWPSSRRRQSTDVPCCAMSNCVGGVTNPVETHPNRVFIRQHTQKHGIKKPLCRHKDNISNRSQRTTFTNVIFGKLSSQKIQRAQHSVLALYTVASTWHSAPQETRRSTNTQAIEAQTSAQT